MRAGRPVIGRLQLAQLQAVAVSLLCSMWVVPAAAAILHGSAGALEWRPQLAGGHRALLSVAGAGPTKTEVGRQHSMSTQQVSVSGSQA